MLVTFTSSEVVAAISPRSSGTMGVGMSLYAKRLDRGKFIWPSASGGAVSISAAQMAYMLEGIDWRNPQLTWRPTRAGMSEEKCGGLRILGRYKSRKSMIHFVSWMPLALLLPKKTPP